MRIWRAGLLMGGTKRWALVLLLVASCVDSPDTLPSTTSTSTPTTTSTSVAEFEWPVVVARDFIHRPRGLVSGVPISFPDPMFCGCLLVTLQDGRVLMVGSGYGIGYAAWIWDPGTGQWVVTGSPNTEYTEPRPKAAVMLDDGRVLVAWYGFDGGSELEVFDPTEGSFRSLGHVSGTKAVLMRDGRVLLATSLESGVVFDPGAETFTPVGAADVPRSDPLVGAVSLEDGRVLVIGYLGDDEIAEEMRGSDQPVDVHASVYEPETDRFDHLGPLLPTGRGAAVTLLHDGRVLITGGERWSFYGGGDEPHSVDAQVFDPTTDRFTALAPMLEPRSHHSAITLADGRVVIVGGAEGRVEVFDPETGLLEQAPELSRPRESPSATLLQDGNILVVGGSDGDRTPEGLLLDWTTLRSAEIYHTELHSIEPSEDVLSGFTLSLEPDIDWSQTKERPTGSQWLELDVPPGGLHGVAYAQAAWEFSPTNYPGETRVSWVGADTRMWGWGGIERQLPDTCDDGCVIREEIFDGRWAAPFTGLYLHIQYEGVIPAEASQITLTIVDD